MAAGDDLDLSLDEGRIVLGAGSAASASRLGGCRETLDDRPAMTHWSGRSLAIKTTQTSNVKAVGTGGSSG